MDRARKSFERKKLGRNVTNQTGPSAAMRDMFPSVKWAASETTERAVS